MGFDPDKWLRIVSPHLSQPPTEAPSKKYVDAANVQADLTHAENIDLDALGEQRIKEAIQQLAEETTGDRGPRGPSAVPLENAIVMVASGKRFVDNNAAFTVVSHEFAAGELRGESDLILVSCYQINLDDISINWTSPGGSPIQICTFAAAPNDGRIDIWVSQATSVFDVVLDYSVVAGSTGVADNVYSGTASVTGDWFDAGGVMDVNFVPDPGTGKSGGQASIYKFNFPRVTQE